MAECFWKSMKAEMYIQEIQLTIRSVRKSAPCFLVLNVSHSNTFLKKAFTEAMGK